MGRRPGCFAPRRIRLMVLSRGGNIREACHVMQWSPLAYLFRIHANTRPATRGRHWIELSHQPAVQR